MSPEMMREEREAFEAWALQDHRDIAPEQFEERTPENGLYYQSDSTNQAYIGWRERSVLALVDAAVQSELTTPARGDGAYEFVKRVGRLSHTQDEGSTRDYDDPDADTEALDRLIGEARELMSLAAAPAAPAGDGWRPIETLPPHGERPWRVLAAIEGFREHDGITWKRGAIGLLSSRQHNAPDERQGFARKDIEALEAYGDMDLGSAMITHWMPLPPAPVEEG